MLKITSEVRSRNFSHLQVGGVYRGKMLMSRALVEGGALLNWCKILPNKKLETL